MGGNGRDALLAPPTPSRDLAASSGLESQPGGRYGGRYGIPEAIRDGAFVVSSSSLLGMPVVLLELVSLVTSSSRSSTGVGGVPFGSGIGTCKAMATATLTRSTWSWSGERPSSSSMSRSMFDQVAARGRDGVCSTSSLPVTSI